MNFSCFSMKSPIDLRDFPIFWGKIFFGEIVVVFLVENREVGYLWEIRLFSSSNFIGARRRLFDDEKSRF